MKKRNIFLLVAALMASLPVLSQISHVSLNSSALNSQDKKIAQNFPKHPALMKPFEQPFRFISEFLFPAFTLNNTTTVNKTGYGDKKTGLPIMENNNKPSSDEPEIIFKQTSFTYPENSKTEVGIACFPDSQLTLYAKALRQYARKNGFDTSYAFLSNMGMLSNKKRFFVVNLVTMEIEQSGLVSHGRGQGASVFDRQYSNQSSSKCTSLGRYKILNKYKGNYGESYRLAGLDSSNQNAYSRNIVLHSMRCIPDMDGIKPACISDGCPAVSMDFLYSLRKIIDKTKKPVLLWIFDSNLEEAVIEDRTGKDQPDFTVANKYHNCSLHSPGNFQHSQLP